MQSFRQANHDFTHIISMGHVKSYRFVHRFQDKLLDGTCQGLWRQQLESRRARFYVLLAGSYVSPHVLLVLSLLKSVKTGQVTVANSET